MTMGPHSPSRRASCSRLYGSLVPIVPTDFEGLRASIQESKGRLVSL
ncbi:BZ3500_MvSof-1268-A1-R1_Chr10-1g02754 [Microbotryum saponariae]|uniref:BZ3500_MvSof-1268-A1-R1_Chr10-1g02754 protein n=1 Tax=Microbotryum saponariae TaxID=289078 RepID=A0A2X0N8E2_9BASI|nr:BZ3500_MvSof-1268-A1-R1_Chr10-1g02754 [Microbotryum saponariae]SDA06243.1 BZ3501_MvSof-1269-A2-R1_Chr10-1g02355 [Microbotryum saponariae]